MHARWHVLPLTALFWAGAAAAQQPASTPAQPPAPQATCTAASADELLSELEKADQGLKGMQAEILLHRTFALEQDRQTRQGMLYFRQFEAKDGQPARRQFHIRFDRQITGTREEPNKEQKFIFDGEWLAEVNTSEKRFDRRQLVAPGESFDPLRVGEGPLPIPIGQKKEDILAKFDVSLLDSAEGLTDESPRQLQAWRKFVAGTCQLRLVPKAGAGDIDFTEIRLWYRKDASQTGGESRWLPRMSRTVNHAGDVTIVQLVNVLFTDTIDDHYFDTAFPAERGWDMNEVPLRRVTPQVAPGPEVLPPAPAGPGSPEKAAPPAAGEPPASPANPGGAPKSPA